MAAQACKAWSSALVVRPRPCSYDWMDDDTIIAALIPEDLPPLPVKPATVGGPKVEDNSSGKKSQARTYPDLLSSPYEEAVFDHLGTSQLVTVKVMQGCARQPSGWGPARGLSAAWVHLLRASSCSLLNLRLLSGACRPKPRRSPPAPSHTWARPGSTPGPRPRRTAPAC